MNEPGGLPAPLVTAGWIWLRHQHATDALENYGWRTDPEIARFDGGPPMDMPFSDFVARFEYDLRFPTTERRAFAIETAESGHIGTVMYYGADYAGQVAELGIIIGPGNARERGAGTAATVLFLRHTWATLPLRRVVLHTLAWNVRAQAAFRRAGFGEVATVDRNGQLYLRMEARREWWLLWDMEGRFDRALAGPKPVANEAVHPGLTPA